MFGRKRIDALEARLTRLEDILTTLAEGLKDRHESEPTSKRSARGQQEVDAIALLTQGLMRQTEASAKIVETLLDRASKQVLRQTAQEMGRKGVLVRERNKAKREAEAIKAKEAELHTLPLFVASCEECKAVLHNRSAMHANDLWRHDSEGHMRQLVEQGIVSQ